MAQFVLAFSKSATSNANRCAWDIDFRRTARVTAWGVAIGGVPMYLWFRYLDCRFPGTSAASVFKKVAVNQLIMSFVHNTSFYCYLVVLNEISLCKSASDFQFKRVCKKAKQKLIMDLPRTQLYAMLYWVPAHILNFLFLQPQFRILYLVRNHCAQLVI